MSSLTCGFDSGFEYKTSQAWSVHFAWAIHWRSFWPPAYKLAWKHITQLSLHPQSLRGRASDGIFEVWEGQQQGRGGAPREGLPSCWNLAVDTPLQSLSYTYHLAHGAWYYCPAATMESHAESGGPGHLGKMTWGMAWLAASASVSPSGPLFPFMHATSSQGNTVANYQRESAQSISV